MQLHSIIGAFDKFGTVDEKGRFDRDFFFSFLFLLKKLNYSVESSGEGDTCEGKDSISVYDCETERKICERQRTIFM